MKFKKAKFGLANLLANPNTQTGLNIASNAIDAFDSGNQFGNKSTGTQIASGALQGASLGASFGPIGAGAGAVLGGAYGAITSGIQRKKEQEMINKRMYLSKLNDSRNTAMIYANNSELDKGDRNASFFASGGQANLSSTKTLGGSILPITGEDSYVQGRSHDSGGVKLPSEKVELEGGETLNGDFVFSKRLGFADKHLSIVKDKRKFMDKLEKNPNDKLLINSINEKDKQIERLKVQQETVKHQLGIQNDLQEMADGGEIFDLESFAKREYELPNIKVIDSSINYDNNPLSSTNEIVNSPSLSWANSKGDSIAVSHNNPRNMKFANWMIKYGAVKGKAGTDGGVFAKFPDVQSGLNASKALLSGKGYRDLTVDRAMKKWSNNGYDGSIYPSVRNKKVSELSQSELDNLMKEQIKNEDKKMYNRLYSSKENKESINKFGGGGRLGRAIRAVSDIPNKAEKIITKASIASSPYFSTNKQKPKGKTDDSLLEDVVEIIDPTGISSYDDVYREGKNYYNNFKNMSTRDKWIGAGSLGLEVLGALPVVGKLGKGIKGLKTIANMTRGASKFDRAMDAYSALQIATNWDSYAMGGYVKFGNGGRRKSFIDANKDEIKEYENLKANRKAGYLNGEQAFRLRQLEGKYGRALKVENRSVMKELEAEQKALDSKRNAKLQLEDSQRRIEIDKMAKTGKVKFKEAGRPFVSIDGRKQAGADRASVNQIIKKNDELANQDKLKADELDRKNKEISSQRLERKLEKSSNRKTFGEAKQERIERTARERKPQLTGTSVSDFERRQQEARSKGIENRLGEIDKDYEERKQAFRDKKKNAQTQKEYEEMFSNRDAEKRARVEEFGRLRESKKAGNLFHSKSKLANVANLAYKNYDKVIGAAGAGYGLYNMFFGDNDKPKTEAKLPAVTKVGDNKPKPFMEKIMPQQVDKKPVVNSTAPFVQPDGNKTPQPTDNGKVVPVSSGKDKGLQRRKPTPSPVITREDYTSGKGLPKLSTSLNTQNKANLYDRVTGQGTFKLNTPVNIKLDGSVDRLKNAVSKMNIPVTKRDSTEKKDILGNVLDNLSIYGDNAVGMLRQYPNVPNPVLNGEIQLRTPSFNSAYANNNQDYRNSLIGLGNLGNSQRQAVAGNLLAKKLSANNQIAGMEANAKTDTYNREAQMNAGIRAGNNALLNKYNDDVVNRNISIGNARQGYLADTFEKRGLQQQDESRQNLDLAKTYLGLMSTDAGVRNKILGDTGLDEVMTNGRKALMSSFGRKRMTGGKLKSC